MLNRSSRKAVFGKYCFAEWFVPTSVTFSSLLTLRTLNLLDLTSLCIKKYATSVCFNRAIPCMWRLFSAFASTARTGFIWYPRSHNNDTIPLTQMLPTLLRTILPPPCSLHWSVAYVCMLSMWDCRAISRPRLMTFECPCNLLNLSRNMSWLLFHFPQMNTCSNCLSRLKCPTYLINFGKLYCVEALTFFDTTRWQWVVCLLDLDWRTNICQRVICSCWIVFNPMVLNHRLSRHVLLESAPLSPV